MKTCYLIRVSFILFSAFFIFSEVNAAEDYSSCDFNQLDSENFEHGWGVWNDGGSDCTRRRIRNGNSRYSIRLRDNSGSRSSMYTDYLDLSSVSQVKIEFSAISYGFSRGEDFYLEYSNEPYGRYEVIENWKRGVDFYNGRLKYYTITHSGDFTEHTRFRIRCDASSNRDQLYIDDVIISVCKDQQNNNRLAYRTYDGTLNNLEHPDYGKTHIPLTRKLPVSYSDGIGAISNNLPSPRHISNQLSDEAEIQVNQRGLSGLVYTWGQFIDHDVVQTEGGNEMRFIPVPDYDPFFTSPIRFTRTKAADGTGTSSPREQENLITAYIDGSGVYGSDEHRANWLRTFKNGKLKMSRGQMLPWNTIDGEYESSIDPTAPKMEMDRDRMGNPAKTFVAGDVRAAEQPNLTALHLLFVREHNRYCDLLIQNGMTNDEKIYQTARKYIGALIQKITYEEWLPTVGIHLDRYNGYDDEVQPDILNIWATAAFRWHTMVENDVILRDNYCQGVGAVELQLKDAFFNPNIILEYGPGVLLRGINYHAQNQTDTKLNNGVRNFLFGQGMGLDLASLNIERGRDHGLPDYKTLRQYYSGRSLSSFSEINSNQELTNKLAKIYEDIDKIDPWVGLYSEPLENGSSLPRTVIEIMKVQFQNLRDGDYYFYLNDPMISYNDLDYIRRSSFTDIIERNTSAAGLPNNAFHKKRCENNSAGKDIKDYGTKACTGPGAKLHYWCSSRGGYNLRPGEYTITGFIPGFSVYLGYAIKLKDANGLEAYFTDHIKCLPDYWQRNSVSLEVICLSEYENTLNCNGIPGMLFGSCYGKAEEITSVGSYSTEQLKSLQIKDNDIEAIRVNNGFQVILYSEDNFEGESLTVVGPEMICLSNKWRNKVNSMEVICTSDPFISNCRTQSIAGAVFPDDDVSLSTSGVSVGVGDYDLQRLDNLGLDGRAIERITVKNGFVFTLFSNDQFGGESISFTGDEIDLGALDGSAASLKVACLSAHQDIVSDETKLAINAKKEAKRVRIDVLSKSTKEEVSRIVEKYNGFEDSFEKIAEISVQDGYQSNQIVYDNKPQNGDNIYRVKINYADGSSEHSEIKVVSIRDLEGLEIYPNPADQMISVMMDDKLAAVSEMAVYNFTGQLMMQKSVGLNHYIQLNVSQLPVGSYLLKVTNIDGEVLNKKLIISR